MIFYLFRSCMLDRGRRERIPTICPLDTNVVETRHGVGLSPRDLTKMMNCRVKTMKATEAPSPKILHILTAKNGCLQLTPEGVHLHYCLGFRSSGENLEGLSNTISCWFVNLNINDSLLLVYRIIETPYIRENANSCDCAFTVSFWLLKFFLVILPRILGLFDWVVVLFFSLL